MIGSNGEQLGILPTDVALSTAQKAGLDLVEISPTAQPPVCKIMNYGKFKYDEKKRAAQARKKQVVVQVKEVKLRPKTNEHDYDFKLKAIRRFIEEGNKSKVTIMFRGREIVHKDIGQKILMRVVEHVRDIAVIEQVPRMEGRQMFMVIAPSPKMKARPAAPPSPAGRPPVPPRPPAAAPVSPLAAPAKS